MGAAVLRNTFAPNAILGGSFLPDDVTLPVLTGSITVGAKTSSTIAVTWPTATDNVAVTGYEVSSDNGATYTAVGLVTSHTFTSLTALTSYNLAVRAFDAAGNRSTALTTTTSTYRAGALGSTILLTTGPIDGNPAGILYNDVVSPADDAKWFSFVITTPPATGTLDINADGTFTFVGPSAETMYYQLEVDGSNVGSPTLVTLYDVALDTTPPTLTGSITLDSKTATEITVSSPTATDEIGVVSYRWSSDGGSTYVTSTQTHTFTGLTADTAYAIRVVARDAAGNDSTPALALSVTTDAVPDTTPPTLTGSILLNSRTHNTINVTSPVATDNVGVVSYRWSSDGGATYVTSTRAHQFIGLTADTAYAIRVVARDAAGNDSTPALALSVTTDTTPIELEAGGFHLPIIRRRRR